MKLSGYTNPIRSFERKMAPDYPSREFRDPGLRSERSSGLGSLHHTMPHLRRLTAIHLQGGGALNPVGQAYASARPNLYNPDPMHRRILGIDKQLAQQYRNPAYTAMPLSGAQLPYAEGGEAPDESQAPDEVEQLMEPDDQLSPEEEQLKQVVVEALAALDGQHPDPKEALAHFIDTFGPLALRDLQEIASQRDSENQGNAQGEEEEEGGLPPGGGGDEGEAEGGLLEGPGSGQSDDIPGTTPSGRPVRLSDGEYVIDAPTVAALGDGSSRSGARRLDAMREEIRRQSYGHNKQAKPMKKGGQTVVIKLGK
jgi:hypothetical protein